jgi:hypothetical protein
MVQSRAKGCRGEREAARYLTSIGFEASRNGRNGYSTDDLIVPGLPNVHVEVKFGVVGMDIGTALLRKAWEQAADGAWASPMNQILGKIPTPVVLWKPPRRPWRLTWMAECGLVTTTGDEAVKTQLLSLKGDPDGCD